MNRTLSNENTTTDTARSLSGELKTKLYPNGECVVYKPRKFKPEAAREYQTTESDLETMRIFRLMCANEELRDYAPLLLGLSLHPIFDKNPQAPLEGDFGRVEKRARKGKTGITSYGGRIVRNAAHLLERDAGSARCVFATVTVPSLPVEQLGVVHEGWHKVVEIYRLSIRRALQEKGLSGEIVTVSEIQEKRHEKTGLPVLHLHSVFVGVTTTGKFAISLKDHDAAWFRALNAVVDIERAKVSYSCNLQRVKKSASGYLAKYLSKGGKSVIKAIDNGFAGWLPKHWWNCSRSLVARVKAETRNVDDFSDWLQSAAQTDSCDVWKWHREVLIETSSGDSIVIALYGQLSDRQTAEIQAYYPLKNRPSG